MTKGAQDLAFVDFSPKGTHCVIRDHHQRDGASFFLARFVVEIHLPGGKSLPTVLAGPVFCAEGDAPVSFLCPGILFGFFRSLGASTVVGSGPVAHDTYKVAFLRFFEDACLRPAVTCHQRNSFDFIPEVVKIHAEGLVLNATVAAGFLIQGIHKSQCSQSAFYVPLFEVLFLFGVSISVVLASAVFTRGGTPILGTGSAVETFQRFDLAAFGARFFGCNHGAHTQRLQSEEY